MDNICFKITINTDATTLFEIATKPDKHFDVADEVVSRLYAEDPVWDGVFEEIEELFGEDALEHLSEMDEDDFKEYIFYTGECEIDYDEMISRDYSNDFDFLAYRVSCEFDVDKFAEKYNLEPVSEEQEK